MCYFSAHYCAIADTTEQQDNILGGPSREDTAVTGGKERVVEGDRLVKGTGLEVTAGGLRQRRGEADAQQQQVSEADRKGIESVMAAAAAGQNSAAPGASGAAALFAEPLAGKFSYLMLVHLI